MASVCTGEARSTLARLLMSTAVILMACVLASHGDAAGPRRWSVALGGPDRVMADREYRYTVALTNDGGEWPSSARAGRTFRLAFDLSERYGEGTVGIEDILIHPVGPQASDGSFPCDAHGGCWFRRSGSQVDFSFTRDNVSVGPVIFDIVVHTASVFRAGDSFRLSATLWVDGRVRSMGIRPRSRPIGARTLRSWRPSLSRAGMSRAIAARPLSGETPTERAWHHASYLDDAHGRPIRTEPSMSGETPKSPPRHGRRAMLAKHSASPQIRGGYRRAVHAARVAEDAAGGPGAQPVGRTMFPKGDRRLQAPQRRIAAWVFAVAALPVLLLAAVGVYAINLAVHTERAVGNIVQPSLPRGPQVAVSTAAALPRPTNTPDALGTIAPLPTDPPLPPTAPAPTVDPIAAIHFDRKDPFTIMLLGVDTREGDTDSRSPTRLSSSHRPVKPR